MQQEAFVYLWYDAPNKKYYLGKHKGTPDDGYTHSSTIWESFTKDTIPEGVSRRILAYGTDEEMCILEHKLLVNRKKRCWDRYYNVNAHSKAIGNLYDVLSEEGIKLWKERMSLASKGKPKPNKDNYQWSKTTPPEERKERFGRPLENNGNWKGGISIGDNKKDYFENDYDDRKKLCKELIEQGLSYYEIKEKHRRALIGYPYALLPQEIKDRKNDITRKRYDRKAKCYCRKDTCDYCLKAGYVLTVKERKRRQAEKDAKKYIRKKAEKQGESTLDRFM